MVERTGRRALQPLNQGVRVEEEGKGGEGVRSKG